MKMNIDHKNNDMIPHFMLVPFLAPGHIIPMVDMAHLLVKHGAIVSFITTPVNAARMKPVIDNVNITGLPIRFVELNFNCKELGIPNGCECFDLIASMEHFNPFIKGLSTLQNQLEVYLQETKTTPTCIISDSIQWWTVDIAKKLNIPRLIFHGPSCFYSLCHHNIRKHKIYKDLHEHQPVEVPDLPHKVTVTKAQSPEWFSNPGYEVFREHLIKSEEAADGVVVNTFQELEHEYIKHYGKILGKKVWPIGPFFMYNKDVNSKTSRGRKMTVDGSNILNWLDLKESKSVLVVTFGSTALISNFSQIIEIGCGLEASNKPFIWVVKEREKTPEVANWLSNGFQERIKDQGLIITGWAPQLAMLSHRAVGGFMTHCGWNSILEAISAGVPMITCPFFADQFVNETLVVEILRIGVSLGVKKPGGGLEGDEVRVGREDVRNAVMNLMGNGKEVEGMRGRVRKYGDLAHVAIEEGGSSFECLKRLVQFAMKTPEKMA